MESQDEATLLDCVAGARTAEPNQLDARLDPFEFISANEISLSRLICWMLNPSSSHREGSKYLHRFLEAFEISSPDPLIVRNARCEICTDAGRRIDIVIECDGFTLAIENKPYTSFGEAQLPDYFSFLALRDRPFALVALKGWKGAVPNEQLVNPIAEHQQFIDGDYHTLVGWMEDAIAITTRDDVREFVRQMLKHVRTNVIGGSSVAEHKQIVDLIAADEARRRSAVKIINAAHSIETWLHNAFARAVEKGAPEGWRVSNTAMERFGRDTGNHHLTIDFDNRLPIIFVFEIGPRTNAAYLGVVRRSNATLSNDDAAIIWSALDDVIFRTKDGGSADWLWCARQNIFSEHGYFKDVSTNIWEEMVEPSQLAARLVELVMEVEQVVRRAKVA